MHISGNELRKGDVLIMDGQLWQCLVSTHRTPGNLRAFVQAKMRHIKDGTQKEVRFSSTEKLDKVDIFERKMQFLYSADDMFTFMDTESYDQVEISREAIGDGAKYLTPDIVISVAFHETTPITIRLPQIMEFEVVEADPEIKGATASASFKSATIQAGEGLITVQVPQFVKVGDWLKINTETDEYLERANKK